MRFKKNISDTRVRFLVLSIATVMILMAAVIPKGTSVVASLLWLSIWAPLFFINLQIIPLLVLLSAASPIGVPFGVEEGIPLTYISILLGLFSIFLNIVILKKMRLKLFSYSSKFAAGLFFAVYFFMLISLLQSLTFDPEAYIKLFLIFCVSVLIVILCEIDFHALITGWIFCGLLLSLEVILQLFGYVAGLQHGLPFFGLIKLGAFAGPTVGGMIGLAVIFLLSYKKIPTYVVMLSMPILIIGISITGYRTWLLSTVVTIIIAALVSLAFKGRYYLKRVIVAFFLIVSSSLLLLMVNSDIFLLLIESFIDDMKRGRIRKWDAAFSQLLDNNPLFGVGYGRIDISNVAGLLGEEGAKNSDSFYIDMLVQFGFVNSMIFGLCFFFMIKLISKKDQYLKEAELFFPAICFIIFWLIGSFFWDILGSGGTGIALVMTMTSVLIFQTKNSKNS